MLNPRPEQIAPRLFWPILAVSLFSGLAGQCLLVVKPQAFTTHFFRNPWMLAAVHLTSLGWLATLFLAVTMQALTVLMHRPQRRTLQGFVGPGLFTVGALALVAFLALWRKPWALSVALAGLGLGFILTVQRSLYLAKGYQARTQAWPNLVAAHAYLGCLLVLGALMALGLWKSCLPRPPLETLDLHIHLALAGFAGLAILGLLPKLLRLFLGATGYAAWPGAWAARAVHAGLLIQTLGWWFGWGDAPHAAKALFFLAALGLAAQVVLQARVATKPLWTSSFALQASALVWLLVAASLDLGSAFRGGPWRMREVAVYVALFGWIGGTLLGTVQRITAVLAWYQRFFDETPLREVPSAWQLVDPRLAWAAVSLHFGAVLLGALGLSLGRADCLRWSGLLGMGALLSTLGLAARSFRRYPLRPQKEHAPFTLSPPSPAPTLPQSPP